MSAERLKHDLQRLTRPDPAAGAMPPAAQPKAIPAGRALGAGPGGGAGIASPLTEEDYAAREWHAAKDVRTSDGLFSFSIQYLKTMTLRDALGQVVRMEFADKPDVE